MPTLNLDGISLNYDRRGQGENIVLVHHLAGNIQSWDFQTAQLSKKQMVLSYDLRGHGKSSKPESKFSINDLADDLKELVNRIGLSEFYLAGHSIGGIIAASFALKNPGFVKGLILIDTSSEPPAPEVVAQWKIQMDIAKKEGVKAVAEFRRRNGLLPKTITENPNLWSRFKRLYDETSLTGFIGCVEAMLNMKSMTKDFARIEVPTVAVVGSLDLAFGAAIDRFARTIPGCKKEVIEGSGHFPNFEKPYVLNKIITDFVQRH